MNADADREAFRRHVAESDRLARGPVRDVDAANAETAALETLAALWKAQGRLVEFLSPLLDESESESVRFNAATGLLGAGHSDVAVPTLETLRDHTDGLASMHAKMILEYWRKQNSQGN